jgi:hypothetical protein
MIIPLLNQRDQWHLSQNEYLSHHRRTPTPLRQITRRSRERMFHRHASEVCGNGPAMKSIFGSIHLVPRLANKKLAIISVKPQRPKQTQHEALAGSRQ